MAEKEPESLEFDACDVCGRTMLRGERTETYVEPSGEERQVCVLCRPRVEHQGWLPKTVAGTRGTARPTGERSRRRRFLRRGGAGRRREAPEAPARDLEEAHHGDPLAEEMREAEAHVEPEDPAGDEEAAQPDDAERSRRGPLGRIPMPSRRAPAGVHAVPTSPEGRYRAAVEAFNSSDYSRTVSSISRSLGRPAVSVGALAGSGTDIRITVAWDLSWYQWAVNLADPATPVRRLGQGSEMSELDAPSREWNAHAEEDGRLSYGEEEASSTA